jgi:hypothetical protein
MGRRGYNMMLDSIANIGSGLDDAAISGLQFGANQAQRQFSNKLSQARFDAEQANVPYARHFAQLAAENESAKRTNEQTGFDVRGKEIVSAEKLAELRAKADSLKDLSGMITPDDYATARQMILDGQPNAAVAEYLRGSQKRFSDAKVSEHTRKESGGAAARTKAKFDYEKKKTDAIYRGEQYRAGVMPDNMITPPNSVMVEPENAKGLTDAQDAKRALIKHAENTLKIAKDRKGNINLRMPGAAALSKAITSGDDAAIRKALIDFVNQNSAPLPTE